MGKTNCGISVASVLTDERFDFSNAYLLSVGVAGSSVENTVMGDVVVMSSVVDYDLGHHADVREMENPTDTTWFHDAQFENSCYVLLNQELTEKVYELVKDIPLETTELTREYMREAFDGAAWAIRDPAVLKGTAVTGDNYWKGKYDHANAVLLTEYYGAPDPYMVTEMEEISVAVAAKRLGMLDRLIILRTSVNMDEFVLGDTPERLWGRGDEQPEFINSRKADIFETALMNSYKVGRRIIETILEGKLRN
jgi:purine nucleoside permease